MASTVVRSEDRITPIVLSVAAVFFAASAYNAVRTAQLAFFAKRKTDAAGAAQTRTSDRHGDPQACQTPPPAKLASQSAVGRVTYTTRPDDCQPTTINSDARPKIHAGALFKLIDIAAGVAARRHAVIGDDINTLYSFKVLKPIFLGDLIHVSASVNRAWGSSMEVGVRIVKETVVGIGSSKTEYVSHSYLTFVALNKTPVPHVSTWGSACRRAWKYMLSGSTEEQQHHRPPKPVLAPIEPTSRLESRRHMLAGRRRSKRLDDSKHGKTREGVSIEVKRRVRQEIVDLLTAFEREKHAPSSQSALDERRQSEMLRSIEMEVMIQAWAQGDDIVSVRSGMVEVNMQGDEPIRFPEADVRAKAKLLGVKVPGDARFNKLDYRLRGSATPTWASGGQAVGSPPATPKASLVTPKSKTESATQSANDSHTLPVAETLTTSMQIVFPQHTNSHGIIFGGNTMSWSEEVAIMACRRIRVASTARAVSWKTVSMDGLEFNVQVGVGELMIVSAIVVRTYSHSCEVYVLAQAEDRTGRRRITNDVLFTLAYDLDGEEDANSKSKGQIITQVAMPSESALEQFAEVSGERRQQRLELRQMLLRVYGT